MYSKNSVGPRMEPWETPELAGHSCKDFPSRTTRSCVFLRKNDIAKTKYPAWNPDFSLWRRPVWFTLSKILDIPTVTALVPRDLLKAMLSDTTFRRFEINWNPT